MPVWLHVTALFETGKHLLIQLPVSAQSQLLHESLLEVQILRFLSLFDVKEKVFLFPDGTIVDQQHLLDLVAVDIEEDNGKRRQQRLTTVFQKTYSVW